MRAYRVAYDGRPFHGFQRQPSVPTVEDALFDALRDLDVIAADADSPPGYAAAGRTDAGASALAQTVAFEAPAWLTPRAFDAELPGSVRVWAAAEAPEDFHATRDATGRRYVYHLYAPDADPEVADDAAARLSGEHDVHNLTPDETGTDRDLAVEVLEEPSSASETRVGDEDVCREPVATGERRRQSVADDEFLSIGVAADGFPRQLVRRLATVVGGVATGDADADRLDRVLAADPLPGHEGVQPAPARSLVLADVTYPALDFRVDEAALAAAREGFREARAEALRDVRATGTVLAGLEADAVAESADQIPDHSQSDRSDG